MVFISSGGGFHEPSVEPSGYNNMLLCKLWNIWAFLAFMLTLRCCGMIVLLRNCCRGGSIVESLKLSRSKQTLYQIEEAMSGASSFPSSTAVAGTTGGMAGGGT